MRNSHLAFSLLNSAGLPVDLARNQFATRGAMRLTVMPEAKMRIADLSCLTAILIGQIVG